MNSCTLKSSFSNQKTKIQHPTKSPINENQQNFGPTNSCETTVFSPRIDGSHWDSIPGFCPGRALAPFALKSSGGHKKSKLMGPRARQIFLNKRRNPTSATQFMRFSVVQIQNGSPCFTL